LGTLTALPVYTYGPQENTLKDVTVSSRCKVCSIARWPQNLFHSLLLRCL